MFTTLQEMEHHIRTVYGDSQISFQSKNHRKKIPIQGVGQGNGAGPQIWAVVSSPVLEMLRTAGCLCIFRMAITGEDVEFVGYAFVDDTDKVVTSPDPKATYKEVAEQLQRAADTWEGGIRATGGAIGPAKSHYYLLEFIWKDGNFRYATPTETPTSISILDKDGIRQNLERIEPDRAQKTLGVYLAPDGNDKDQFTALLEKSKAWADQVRAGHLPRHLVLQSLKQSLWMSLKWPMPATCLTEDQIEQIMRPALKVALPRIGFVSTFPKDLVHATKKYQGLAIPHLFVHQLATHIQKMLRFCHSSSLTGELLRTSMQQLKIELGTQGSILELPFKTYGGLATCGWIASTWKDMQQFRITIADTTPNIPMRTSKDQLIIQAFVQAGFKSDKLVLLNRMRLYLRVATFSDLMQANGTDVKPDIWNGIRTTNCRPQIEWPKQGPIPPSHWAIWQKALTESLGISIIKSRNKCPHPGHWIDNDEQWEWFFHQSTERLYQRTTTGWEEWHYLPGRSSRQAMRKFHRPEPADAIPPNLVRASVYEQGMYRCLQSLATPPLIAEGEAIEQQPTSLRENIGRLPEDAKWAVSEWYIRLNATNQELGEQLSAAIQSPEGAICISDGSFKNARGTACFTILGPSEEGSIICPMIVPGGMEVQNAYRSELAGLYGAVVMINVLCKTYNIRSGKVQICCDGLSAINKAIGQSGDVDPSMQQFDIVAAIRTWKTNRRLYGPASTS